MNQFTENNQHAQYKRNRRITTLLFILILFFGSLFALRGNSGSVTAQVNETMLGVIGTTEKPTFVQLEEIEELHLVESMDFGSHIEGELTDNTCSGTYQNDEYGTYTLHIYRDKSPYIVVRYEGGNTLVFNLGRESLTKDTYEDLQEAVENLQ